MKYNVSFETGLERDDVQEILEDSFDDVVFHGTEYTGRTEEEIRQSLIEKLEQDDFVLEEDEKEFLRKTTDHTPAPERTGPKCARPGCEGTGKVEFQDKLYCDLMCAKKAQMQ